MVRSPRHPCGRRSRSRNHTPVISENRYEYTGICGSDLHEYLNGPIFILVEKEHPYSSRKDPLTPDHEFASEIVEVGTGVTNVKVGDCITVGPILDKDGLKDKYNLGKNLSFVGLAADGGFTSYCVVDGELCHKLSDSIDYEQGTSEPAAAALYAVRQSSFKAGDTATVFGYGPIGLPTIEALRAAGATTIYAIELSPERQAKARKLGAVVINPSKVSVVEHIKAENDDDVNVSFELTGVAPVLKQAIEAVENDGKCVIVSI